MHLSNGNGVFAPQYVSYLRGDGHPFCRFGLVAEDEALYTAVIYMDQSSRDFYHKYQVGPQP